MASSKATSQGGWPSAFCWLIILRNEHVLLARSLFPSHAVYLLYKGEPGDLGNKQLTWDQILAKAGEQNSGHSVVPFVLLVLKVN